MPLRGLSRGALGGLALLAAFAAGAAPGASAAREGPTDSTRAARQADLAAIRVEIANLERRLEQAKSQQSGLEGELAAAGIELELQERRVAEAEAASRVAAAREAASAEQVRRLEAVVAASRREFRRHLTGLYRLGSQGYLRLLLILKPDERLLPSIRLMRYLARRDRAAIDSFQAAGRDLEAQRLRLQGEAVELGRWAAREQSRRAALVAARGKKATLLARVERERQDLASRAGELADKEQKLAALLDLLEGSNGDALAGSPMQRFRGVLDWPVRGRVSERFGPRLDPRYHTQVPHNGIDLATSPGSEVRAVFPGKVLFAAPFEGYGPTVVVLHPGRVFSLYAGLSELRASREGMVSLGEVLGLAADKLYFEIRVEKHPDDPLTWLR